MARRIYKGYNETLRKEKQMRKNYGFGSFLFDATMVFATGGLWIIRIFVREMRNR